VLFLCFAVVDGASKESPVEKKDTWSSLLLVRKEDCFHRNLIPTRAKNRGKLRIKNFATYMLQSSGFSDIP
jgi:hypothetical protein